ncbi:hypothetical protein M3Y99_00772200 [Aphelenchoides fujianensis]|nr:hypothetical protein M3Y99_00772200 [Aphelenchoides fujianensis]
MLPSGLHGIPPEKLKNLPPLSRIETNALFNDAALRGRPHRTRGSKFAHHTADSPPIARRAVGPSDGEMRRTVGSPTVSFSMPPASSVDAEDADDASGSNTTTIAIPQATRVMPEGEETESQGPGEQIALRASAEKEFDHEDVEARMPADRSSMKSSLKVEDTILRLNIGGTSYRLMTRSILKYGPTTLLGRLCRMVGPSFWSHSTFILLDHDHRRMWSDGYFENEQEYFFERCPRMFDPIYDFFATGKLHVEKTICFDRFMSELRFWAVSKAKMDDCCSPFANYCLTRKVQSEHPNQDHFIGLRCAKLRRRLWLVLEGHSNSKWWKFFEITSTSFVVLSITALIMSSIPEFQVPETSRAPEHLPPATFPTYPKVVGFTVESTTIMKEGEAPTQEMVEHPVFTGENVRKVRWAFLTIRLLRVLRVVRIAKLGRFSPGLANFALTLRKSKKQLQMVSIVLLTIIIFFSTLIYFLERDSPNTTFNSIPDAFWWCLFSQSKHVPQSAAGKFVGGIAIVCGIIVIVVKLREEKVIKKYAQQRTGDHL